jgi:hypothetical protein
MEARGARQHGIRFHEARKRSWAGDQHSHDLVAADVGELLANKVQDHLSGCSVGEWQRLSERVAFYMADDNTTLSFDPTVNEG